MSSTSIDIKELIQQLADAATLCVTDLTTTRRETLYAFALYTVDDLAGVNPSASSCEGFEQRKAKLTSDSKQLEWLAENGISVDSTLYGDYRWNAYEWEHECHMVDSFSTANKLIQQLREKHGDDFARLTGSILAALVLALRQLDLAGVFDVPNGRDTITVFCSKPSSFDTVWLERESARLLNPPNVYSEFEQQRIAYITDEFDDEVSETQQQFIEIIEASGMFSRDSKGT